jgi:hypothetical protein
MKIRPIKSRRKKKKGQMEFSPALFIAGIVVLLILAPIILKVMSSVKTGLGDALNSTDPNAVTEMNYVVDTGTNFIDYLLVIMFFINLIILFISAFFIDTSPIFLVLYIMFAFVFILLLPNMMDAVDQVWSKFASETGDLPLSDWIRSNMIMFTLGVFVLTGIIMYTKFKWGGTSF